MFAAHSEQPRSNTVSSEAGLTPDDKAHDTKMVAIAWAPIQSGGTSGYDYEIQSRQIRRELFLQEDVEIDFTPERRNKGDQQAYSRVALTFPTEQRYHQARQALELETGTECAYPKILASYQRTHLRGRPGHLLIDNITHGDLGWRPDTGAHPMISLTILLTPTFSHIPQLKGAHYIFRKYDPSDPTRGDVHVMLYPSTDETDPDGPMYEQTLAQVGALMEETTLVNAGHRPTPLKGKVFNSDLRNTPWHGNCDCGPDCIAAPEFCPCHLIRLCKNTGRITPHDMTTIHKALPQARAGISTIQIVRGSTASNRGNTTHTNIITIRATSEAQGALRALDFQQLLASLLKQTQQGIPVWSLEYSTPGTHKPFCGHCETSLHWTSECTDKTPTQRPTCERIFNLSRGKPVGCTIRDCQFSHRGAVCPAPDRSIVQTTIGFIPMGLLTAWGRPTPSTPSNTTPSPQPPTPPPFRLTNLHPLPNALHPRPQVKDLRPLRSSAPFGVAKSLPHPLFLPLTLQEETFHTLPWLPAKLLGLEGQIGFTYSVKTSLLDSLLKVTSTTLQELSTEVGPPSVAPTSRAYIALSANTAWNASLGQPQSFARTFTPQGTRKWPATDPLTWITLAALTDKCIAHFEVDASPANQASKCFPLYIHLLGPAARRMIILLTIMDGDQALTIPLTHRPDASPSFSSSPQETLDFDTGLLFDLGIKPCPTQFNSPLNPWAVSFKLLQVMRNAQPKDPTAGSPPHPDSTGPNGTDTAHNAQTPTPTPQPNGQPPTPN